MKQPNFFISENEFKVWHPSLDFIEKSEDSNAYNSRQLRGVMTTGTKDRQKEKVFQKGLIWDEFLSSGCFNDNHSTETTALVGYPEEIAYSDKIVVKGGRTVEGWLCRGYIIKGYRRADDIWQLAKALQETPDKRLGFSIEGKAIRRSKGCIEKAIIRNMAITREPVNIEATWEVLTKSFFDEDVAMKSLSAGYGAAQGPAGQSGGAALSPESLEHDKDKRKSKKLKRVSYVLRSMYGIDIDDIYKAFDYAMEIRPDFDEDAALELVGYILKSKGVAA